MIAIYSKSHIISSPNVILTIKSRMIRWANTGEMRNTYKILFRKLKEMSLERPRRRWQER